MNLLISPVYSKAEEALYEKAMRRNTHNMIEFIVYSFTFKVQELTLTQWQILKPGLKVCHFGFGKFVYHGY